MNPIDLRAAERKVFRATTDHGVWDLYLGWILAALGASALIENLGFGNGTIWFAGLVAVALGLFIAGNKFVIQPRLGKVRFRARRKASMRAVSGLLGVAVLVGLLMWWVSASMLDAPGWAVLPLSVFMGMCLGGFSLTAYLLDIPRLYLYGVFFALALAGLEFIQGSVARTLPIIGAGLIILAIGLVLFLRFLRMYPLTVVTKEDETHDPRRA